MTRSFKDYFQYGSALMLILSGIVLTFICFFVNGDVTGGVLCYMAQALTFAGGVFGISLYFHNKFIELKNEINKYINKHYNTQHENSQ